LEGNSIDEIFNKGKNFERMGEYKQAIKCFEKILQVDPTNHLAKLRLITNYKKIGEVEKANYLQNELNSSIEKAEDIKDEDLEINSILDSLISEETIEEKTEIDELESVVSSLIEDIDEKIETAKGNITQQKKGPQPIIVYPDQSEIIIGNKTYQDRKKSIEEKFQGVMQLYKTQQFEQALIRSKEILKLDRKFAPAWFIIGAIYGRIKNVQKSLVYLQKAVELDPKNDQYLTWLSWVFAKLRFFTKSLKAAEKAIKINIENASAWQNLGFAYKNLDDLRRALWCFKHANSIEMDKSISQQISELESQDIKPFDPFDKEMKLCHRCGREVRKEAKFCDNCGVSLETSPISGKEKDESIKQCLICKKNIVKEKPVVCKTCFFNFHRECLLRWIEIHKRCPNCGGEVGWV